MLLTLYRQLVKKPNGSLNGYKIVTHHLLERVVAFAVVEGVFFSEASACFLVEKTWINAGLTSVMATY